jgi:hypothetical protein
MTLATGACQPAAGQEYHNAWYVYFLGGEEGMCGHTTHGCAWNPKP